MGIQDIEKQNGVPDNGNDGDHRKFSCIKQQQSDGCEIIPPYRRLKVLLVEDDDSTRHIVAALLRNCGYQVVSVANGLQAWALLDDKNGDFDLVLTDVVMPGLSGIGLLSRIMHHENTKKIPVIMMSSHDSTHVVFKCLSKGAADFLVKPVRKNELKNLWQHSWRRSQSSSGSESETGRVNRCRGSSDEMSSQSDSDDVRVSDRSDNGSATQSSYTKRGAELESPRKAYLKRGRRKDADTIEDLESLQKEGEEEAVQGGQPDAPAADLIRNIANEQVIQRVHNNEQPEVESEMGGSNSPEFGKDGNSSDPTSTSKLDLSLRSSSAQQADHNEPNVLRQSGVSAFSRYNTLKQQEHQQQQQESQQQQSFEQTTDDKDEPAKDTFLLRPPDQMMSFTHPVQYGALVSYDQSLQPGAGAAYYYAQPALAPWQHAFSPQNRHHHHHEHAQAHAELMEQQQRSFQAFTNILAHHHHYHIEHHHHENNENKVQTGGRSSRDVSPAGMEAPGCCGSTNVTEGTSNQVTNNGFSGSSHGNNGSMSGSNNGSNVFTNNYSGSNNNLTLHGGNGDSGSGNLLSSGSGNLLSAGSAGATPPAPEQNRVRREAALNKFRQKRKERCFEKKVRYQSRKRLAEQRPRVRGQFVSQAVYDSSMNLD